VFEIRWRIWRSPDGQPSWARPALLAIAAVSAVVYAWNLTTSGYATFYAIAVKSMSVSWKAFFYGALDPGATITIDKLAGAFLPQALCARIFGYHQWSVTLPQVIEGVVAVLAMYRLVRRWFGAAAGLLAAGILGLTPILASMFGHPMEDGALTMCLVLAADAAMRALTQGRLRPLIWAGVWIGLGFQAKMLQAWMALPALAIAYLVAAPVSWRRRLAHLGIAGGVTLAVSLSWILLYTVTPAADRPYVDGSTNNNAFSMVFGYNGLDRFGINVPGSVPSMFGGGDAGGGQGGPGGGGTDWAKLLGGGYASQVGWLYPLALIGLVLGLVWYRRRIRTDPAWGGFLLWGLWLATYGLIFSRITIPHTAYMASLAPPVAALSAAGIVLCWRGYRDRRASWALPLVIVTETGWTLYISTRFPTFLPWLRWLVVGAAALALVVLLARRRALVPAMALGVAALLAVPTAWSFSVLDRSYAGSAFDASAGPGGGRPGGGRGPGPTAPAGFPGAQDLFGGTRGAAPTGPNLGPGGGGTDTLSSAQSKVHQYLMAHRDGTRFVAATTGWNSAGPYIMATGQAYLPMGGFAGSVPEPTLARAQQLVRTGQLKFFLLGGGGFGGGRPGGFGGGGGFGDQQNSGTALSAITAWVTATCAQVPEVDQNLYRC
jgi:4-amino-4-deoxy-L-arabinose transferase-like glycosyltransferase